MGTIEPLDYVPSGLAMRFFDTPTAYRIGRLAMALMAVALIGLGVAAYRRLVRRQLALLGVLLFLTPGTLAVLASGSPSAIEAAAAVCFFASALALARSQPLARFEWTCLAVSGFALATSRSLGPIWILIALAVALAAGDWRRALDNANENSRAAYVTVGAIGIGAASTAVWEAVVQPHVPFDVRFFFNQIAPTLSDAPTVAKQFVVSMGTLPPSFVALSWLGLIGTSLAVGARVASVKERRAIALSLLSLVAMFVMLSAAVLRQNGFGIQARHLLPIFAVVTMTFGLCLDHWRRPPPLVPLAVAGVAGAVLALSWGYLNASFATEPRGLVLRYVSIGDALNGFVTWWSVPFVGGVLLACGALVFRERPHDPVQNTPATLETTPN